MKGISLLTATILALGLQATNMTHADDAETIKNAESAAPASPSTKG